jgi:hypothetical protein
MPGKRDPRGPDSEDGDAGEKGGDVETEWSLTCLDCDFSMQIDAEGHPRDGPPDVVRNRVTTHKHTTDESHVVRVAGRRADRDRDGTIDPSLVTDGGSEYCAQCHRSVAREDRVERGGEVYHRQCAPDDVVDHRTLDDLRTDGGTGYYYCPDCGDRYQIVTESILCCNDDDGDDEEAKAVLPDGGREEIGAQIRIPIQNSGEADAVFAAEDALLDAGVTFDTGTDVADETHVRIWELDWSLDGATVVEADLDEPGVETDGGQLFDDAEVRARAAARALLRYCRASGQEPEWVLAGDRLTGRGDS